MMNAENIFQWDDVYPSESILKADIAAAQMFAGVAREIVSLFVLNQERGIVFGASALLAFGGKLVIINGYEFNSFVSQFCGD